MPTRSFADLLRAFQGRRTAAQVAPVLKVTRRCVTYWLAGASLPTLPKLPKLARRLRCRLPRLRRIIVRDRARRAGAL